MNKFILFLISLLFLLSIFFCSSNSYVGPNLPMRKVGLLEGYVFENARIYVTIDGKICGIYDRFDQDKAAVTKVLPGKHIIGLRYHRSLGSSGNKIRWVEGSTDLINLPVKAGHKYKVRFKILSDNIIYWIEDKSTGEKYFNEKTRKFIDLIYN